MLIFVSAVPFGLAVLLDWALTQARIWARGSHAYTSDSSVGDWLILSLTELLVFAPLLLATPVFVALHRSLAGIPSKASFLPSYRSVVVRYLKALACLVLAYLVPVLGSGFILTQFTPRPSLWLPVSVLTVGHVLGLYLVGRLGLVLPALATERAISYRESWRMTERIRIQAMLALFVSTLPLLVVYLAVTLALYLPVLTGIFSGSPAVVGAAVVKAMNTGVWVSTAFFFLIGTVIAGCLSVMHERLTPTGNR